jgi:hypothetical protein
MRRSNWIISGRKKNAIIPSPISSKPSRIEPPRVSSTLNYPGERAAAALGRAARARVLLWQALGGSADELPSG